MEWDEETDYKQLLYNFQIIDENGQLTVAGALFFAKSVCRFLPQAGIEMNFSMAWIRQPISKTIRALKAIFLR